ncbi:MAG: zf-TFIIB domain-containing protein [Planctomycetes bacterium]|nr:zf-TFIIB domain-containing protein [Planctomycetota bacterium]
MRCPRCTSVVLDERDRDGIQIDSCPQCRGVWLDRGELERLVARATLELEQELAARSTGAPSLPGMARGTEVRRHDDDDDDDDDDRRRWQRGHPSHPGGSGPSPAEGQPRRRRWFEVFDLFD